MMQTFAITPLFIIFAGTVMIMLIALTMRAVIRREKAMINAEKNSPQDIATYISHWRPAA